MTTINETDTGTLSTEIADAGYSAKLNLPRMEGELASTRRVLAWLNELDGYLAKARVRDFDLFFEDEPEERATNRFKLATALHRIVEEEQKGKVSFPVDHLTRLRWATGLLTPWTLDVDLANFTKEQGETLAAFFAKLEEVFLEALAETEQEDTE